MRFNLAVAFVVLIGLAFAVPEASASTNSCRADDRCTARTADTHVDGAVVSMDSDTAGRYRLACVKGSQRTVQKGTVAEGERLVIVPEINNAACGLTGRGFSDGTARVRVTLTH